MITAWVRRLAWAPSRVVDDKRIDVRQRTEQRVRPAFGGQADSLARQPFQVAVLADVQQGIGAVGVAQPEVERQVAVRRHQVGIVVDRRRIELIAARRLDADEGQAIAQAGDHHPPVAEHRVLLRLAQRASTAWRLRSGRRAKQAR